MEEIVLEMLHQMAAVLSNLYLPAKEIGAVVSAILKVSCFCRTICCSVR